MADLTVQQIVDEFLGKIAARLDPEALDGPLRLDPTRTVVLIPLKQRGPIHVHTGGPIDDGAVENVLRQIQLVPSLKGLVIA